MSCCSYIISVAISTYRTSTFSSSAIFTTWFINHFIFIIMFSASFLDFSTPAAFTRCYTSKTNIIMSKRRTGSCAASSAGFGCSAGCIAPVVSVRRYNFFKAVFAYRTGTCFCSFRCAGRVLCCSGAVIMSICCRNFFGIAVAANRTSESFYAFCTTGCSFSNFSGIIMVFIYRNRFTVAVFAP